LEKLAATGFVNANAETPASSQPAGFVIQIVQTKAADAFDLKALQEHQKRLGW